MDNIIECYYCKKKTNGISKGYCKCDIYCHIECWNYMIQLLRGEIRNNVCPCCKKHLFKMQSVKLNFSSFEQSRIINLNNRT